MGTSSTIVFKDEYKDIYFVNRGSDGYPEVVLPDIKKVIEEKENSWSGSEIGLMVSSFLGITYDPKERFPNYEIIKRPRGDDSYQYYVFYDKVKEAWSVSVGELTYSERIVEKLESKEPIICQKCFEIAKAEGENEYKCTGCKESISITYDEEKDFKQFKINDKRANIVFKRGNSEE